MKRTTVTLTLVAMLGLAHAPAVLAGGSLVGPLVPTTGPAISATFVINPTYGSPNFGVSAARFAKGQSSSGAVFIARPNGDEVTTGFPRGWHRGCGDGVSGIDPDPALASQFVNDTIETVNNNRFLNQTLDSWIPAAVVTSLIQGLGITSSSDPIITDLDNTVCTAAGTWTDALGTHTIFSLSFTAVIQFAK